MISGWVFSQNLRPLFEMFSTSVGCRFDASDWMAIEHGLSKTNADADVWFSYPLVGSVEIDIEIAWSDPSAGGDEVLVQVPTTTSPPTDIRLTAILDVLNNYVVTTDRIKG